MKSKIIIGSRASKLALIYAQKAKDQIVQNTKIGEDDILIKGITTKGDLVKDKRISEFGGKGLFSSNIENELIKKKIHIAVHALKDMPAQETDNLVTNIFLERNDPREVLITRNKEKLKELKENSIIGTSSYRREFQLRNIRKDLRCKLIRGNIDTRIKKLNDGFYDGIILSLAGIKSLRMEHEVSEIFSNKMMLPSAGQGIIALQSHKDDEEINSILKNINHYETFLKAQAERNVLKILEGNCETAIGVQAEVSNNQLTLEAELFSLDGSKRFYEKKSSKIENAKELGKEVGEILKKKSNNSYKI